MRRLTLLAALISFGCAPQIIYHTNAPTHQPKRTIPVAIDKNFTQAEQDQLDLAVDDWNKSLNGQMLFTVYADKFDMEDGTISYIYKHDGVILLSVKALGSVMYNMSDNTLAVTSTHHEIYFVKDRIALENIRYIALHELGHFLGAKHSSAGLMYPEYNRFTFSCIDYSTVEQVARFNNLDASKMNWCEIK